MPAGEIVKGRNLRIKIADNTVYHATECSFSTTLELEGIATKDTAGNVQSAGNYEWSLSTSALVAVKSTGSSQNDTFSILEKYLAKTAVDVEFTTDVANDIILSGSAYLSSCNITAPTNGTSTYDVVLTGDGTLTLDRIAS